MRSRRVAHSNLTADYFNEPKQSCVIMATVFPFFVELPFHLLSGRTSHWSAVTGPMFHRIWIGLRKDVESWLDERNIAWQLNIEMQFDELGSSYTDGHLAELSFDAFENRLRFQQRYIDKEIIGLLIGPL